MRFKVFSILIFTLFFIQIKGQTEENGVVSFDLPAKNSLKFNKFLINPTFSYIREDESFLSFFSKRQWVGFEGARVDNFFSFSSRFRDQNSYGLGVFQNKYNVYSTFGLVANFTQNIEINRDTNFSFGLNLAYLNSGLNSGAVITNTDEPGLDNIPKHSLISINPGINYSTGYLDFGIVANNIFYYNFNPSGLVQEDPAKTIGIHGMYTGYLDGYGFLERAKFSTLIRSEIGKENTAFAGSVLFNAPKAGWAQAGYHTLNGVSVGLGFIIAKKFSIGYNIEKALGNFNQFGYSHEFTLAYKLRGYGDFEDEKPIVKATSKTNPNANNKAVAVKKKTPQQLAQERAAALALKQKQRKDSLDNARLRREKELAEAKAKAEEAARLKAEKDRLNALNAKDAAEARARAEAEARLKAEQDKARALADAERQRQERLANEARMKAEAAARLKAEQERLAREKAEADRLAKERADAQVNGKLEEASRLKAEQERLAKEKAEAEAKAKADAAARAKAEADRIANVKAEAARLAKEKADAEARLKAEQERLAKEKAEAEAKAKAEAAARAKAEADRIANEKAEAARLAKEKADAEARMKAEEASRLKAEQERLAKEKAEAEAKAKADAAARAKAEADRIANEKAEAARLAKEKADAEARLKAEQERLAKEKAEAEAKAKADAAARAKAEADRIANEKAEAARLAKEKADAEARLKAEEASRLKAEQERLAKEKAEAEAKAKAEAAARAKAEADRIANEKAEAARLAKEKADAEARLKAEEASRLKAEQERLAKEKAEAEAKAKAEAAARAKAEADRIANEKAEAARLAKEKADAEARLKAEEASRLKAEQERLAKEKAEAEAKAKAEAEANAKAEEEERARLEAQKTAEDKEIDNLKGVITDSQKLQSASINKFKDLVATKEKELLDMRKANDDSEKGIVAEVKEVEFQSTSAANRAIESLKQEIELNLKQQDQFINEFKTLASDRLKKVPNKNDAINQSYVKTIAKLEADRALSQQQSAALIAKLEKIKEETEIEKKRRIKRALFDNSQAKYQKDRAALSQIKATTNPTGQVYQPTDFDYGDGDQTNMQIVKNVENTKPGFYLVLAAHKNEARRDAFLKKAIQAGETNVDFFYDVNTSTYFIYSKHFDEISEADGALSTKGSKPYNGKMVIIKVEKQ